MLPPKILRDFPDHLETDRLFIRSPQPGDGPAFNAATLEALDGIRTWLGLYQDGPPTVEQSESIMREKHAHFLLRQDLMLLIFRKTDGLLVASSGLHPRKWEVPSFEIGYWARPSCQGRGYVTEAVRGMTDFAFTHLHAVRVQIHIDTLNHASMAVAQRAGFTHEGTRSYDNRSPDGSLRHTHIFAQVRPPTQEDRPTQGTDHEDRQD